LFRTSDLSLVKAYCQEEWRKILAGTVSPQDFTIAKEVKLGSYSCVDPFSISQILPLTDLI
jgi:DNA polymerase zeta